MTARKRTWGPSVLECPPASPVSPGQTSPACPPEVLAGPGKYETTMTDLSTTLVNFATAASTAQKRIQDSEHPMLISLFEFQYQTTVDVKASLDFSDVFSESAGVGTSESADHASESDKASFDAGMASDKQVGLMIHCVMQPPSLAQGSAAQGAQVQGLQGQADASIQQASSGGGDGS